MAVNQLTQANVFAENWLDVEYRGSVQRLEAPDPDPEPFYRHNFDPVQPDGVRTVRRAGTENPFLQPVRIARGWTLSTSRDARWSQVRSMTSVPGFRLRNPSSTSGRKTNHASGAPSSGCRGAAPRSRSGDSTLPMGFNSILVMFSHR
jgi:hypothetical protein